MHAHHHHAEHAHSHSHAHGGVPSTPQQVRSLKIALVLVSCFSAAELWVSVQSNSLSLRADAGHMVMDVFAIAIALWAAAQSEAKDSEVKGIVRQRRIEAIAAFINGSLLLLVSLWLGYEAISELRVPPTEILSTSVAITAAVGLGINGLNAYFLHAHADDNLNLRAAFLHMLADAGSCLGVLVGALLIAKFGWYWADGLVSGAIALLIFSSAFPLIRQSWATLNPAPVETERS